MPELDDLHGDDLHGDDLMNAVFADVRQEVAGYIRPAGAAAAVATVRRRRRNRTIAGAALAVALIVGPAIGLAWAQTRPDGSPDVADPTPSVSASESAPATPSAGPSGSGSPSILDPGIPLSQLRNMTLSVPQWPDALDTGCPSGSLKFTDGKSQTRTSNHLPLQFAGDPVYVDVNADARNETVIRVDCPLQGLFTQVLAFSRGADGKVSTLGKVVGTHVEGADVQKIWKIEPGGAGTVRVDVGDVSPCCGIPADLPQHQWRSYGWDGQRFRQTGGQTAFPVNPKKTDLAVSIAPFRMTTDGQFWVGQLTVTVTNKGPNAAHRLQVMLQFPLDVTIKGPDGAACGATDASASNIYSCRFGQMAAGTTKQVRVEVTAIVNPSGRTTSAVATNGSPEGDGYPDLKQSDNSAQVVSP